MYAEHYQFIIVLISCPLLTLLHQDSRHIVQRVSALFPKRQLSYKFVSRLIILLIQYKCITKLMPYHKPHWIHLHCKVCSFSSNLRSFWVIVFIYFIQLIGGSARQPLSNSVCDITIAVAAPKTFY